MEKYAGRDSQPCLISSNFQLSPVAVESVDLDGGNKCLVLELEKCTFFLFLIAPTFMIPSQLLPANSLHDSLGTPIGLEISMDKIFVIHLNFMKISRSY